MKCGADHFGVTCPTCTSKETQDHDWDRSRAAQRSTLCPECGSEMVPGQSCEVCDVKHFDETEESEEQQRFCNMCGNVFYGNGDCPVCTSGRAPRKKQTLHLCPGCGNEVEDIHACPICADGRSVGRRKEPEHKGPMCPQCNEPLEAQDFDGETVLVCTSCLGMLFGPDALERVLDRLRESAETDTEGLTEERIARLRQGSLPKSVRYKPCPICKMGMTRRNYLQTSGIILEICGQHGTWVDQATFGQLSDFVTRGGDRYLEAKRQLWGRS